MTRIPGLLLAGALLATAACTGDPAERAYRDPAGRFALDVPRDVRLDASADGGHLVFVSEESGDSLLVAEVGPVDTAAVGWLDSPVYQGNRFIAHVLFRTQEWCAPNGIEGNEMCNRVNNFVADTTEGGLETLRFVPILVRMDTAAGREQSSPLGRVWAVNLDGTGAPDQVFLLRPAHRAPVTAEHGRVATRLLSSLRAAE